MKKLMFGLIFLSGSLFVQKGYGQQDDQFQKQVEEVMRAREEMMKSLMDDSLDGDMEKRMLEMMKRFSSPGMRQGFGLDDSEGPIIGEYDWVVTDEQKILKLKVKQVKDHPLDIKIEKGSVRVKGDVESTSGSGKNKVVRKSSFERNFSLPADVDQTTPEFENKDGELLIKFKRLSAHGDKKKKVTTEKKTLMPKGEERSPLAPEKDDLSI